MLNTNTSTNSEKCKQQMHTAIQRNCASRFGQNRGYKYFNPDLAKLAGINISIWVERKQFGPIDLIL